MESISWLQQDSTNLTWRRPSQARLLGVWVLREPDNRRKHREAIPHSAAPTGGDVEEAGGDSNLRRRQPKLNRPCPRASSLPTCLPTPVSHQPHRRRPRASLSPDPLPTSLVAACAPRASQLPMGHHRETTGSAQEGKRSSDPPLPSPLMWRIHARGRQRDKRGIQAPAVDPREQQRWLGTGDRSGR